MADSFERDFLFDGSSAEALFRQAPRLVAGDALWNKIAADFPRAEKGAAALPSGFARPTPMPRLTRWMEVGFALAASLTLLASPWFGKPRPNAGIENTVAMHSMAAALAIDNEEHDPIDRETLTWLAALGELGVEDNEYTLAFQSP